MALEEEVARKKVQETEHASGVSPDVEQPVQCGVEVSTSAEESTSVLENGLEPPSDTPHQGGMTDAGS